MSFEVRLSDVSVTEVRVKEAMKELDIDWTLLP
jgi:hypothetical protein|uniref:Uncharacterized protein n=1 Tax=Pleomorphic virus ThalV2 TaxID=3115753 RepID=A0AAT9JGZ0_9VIRU